MPNPPFPELQNYLPGRQPRAPSTTQAAETWLDRTMREERDDQIKIDLQDAPPPDAVARATRLARQTGEPPALVEGNEDDIERLQQARAFGGLVQQSDAIGRWAASNPRGAASARDDTSSLGALGSAWDVLKNIPGRFAETGGWALGGSLTDTWNAAGELTDFISSPVYAGMSALSEATGLEVLDPEKVLNDRARQRAANSAFFTEQAALSREKYRGETRVTEGLLAGVESVPLTIAAVATRNPNTAASVMGALSGASGYAEARRQGVGTGDAIRYGLTQGAIEAGTERIPVGTLVEMIAKRTPWGKTFVRELGQEMTGEQVATVLQDLNDWAYLPDNRGKTFGDFIAERPDAAFDTALGVVSGSTITTAGISAAQKATDVSLRVADRMESAAQAKREKQFLDKAAKAAEGSKLRQRDPEAFRDLLRLQAEDAGSKTVFIPGEAVRDYQQSDSYDPDSDPFDPAIWDVSEAAGVGGDLVMPIEDVLTDIVGTPAWAAIRDHVRLAPGGMSAIEAQSFDEGMDGVMADLSDRMSKVERDQRKADTVREKLVDQVTQLFGESFTAPASRQIAELAVARAGTRAQRLGMELQGDEFTSLQVRQVMPESVRDAVAVDNLDLVINAMRVGADPVSGVGPTLLQWIGKRGGLNDGGGDLKAMGVPGKFLRSFDPRQTTMGGLSGQGDFGIDTVLRAAVESGYFPELAGVEQEGGPSQLDTQALLSALGEELAGRPRYVETREDNVRMAADDLRAMLEDAGLSPDAMSDAEVRAAVDRMSAEPTEGGYEQEARGRIIFDGNQRIIELFQGRNLSTPLHELSHMWLEEMQLDASLPGAPEQLKADWETVKAYFKANGHAIGKDGRIPVEAHELWARSGERYFMEGKAPSSALVRMFESFRAWLVQIYRTMDRLRAPITPEIREVFDRMLATDEEILAAQERQAIEALFKDAASAGMSDAEFRAYQNQVDGAKADAHAKLIDKTMAVIRRRETERYRESRKTVRAEEQERIDGSPLYRAMAEMKAQRVSREWIVDRMGEDALALLPKRVPPLYVEGGVDPNITAEMTGYSDAQTMIEALIGAERAHRQAKEGGDKRSMRERAIETATDEEMNRRYGDPLNDGSIEREALAAVHSDMQGEVIASELRVLSRQTGQKPTPYQIARQWARDKIRSGVVAEEASPSAIQRYARNAAKAGRAAEQAMLAQDVNETFRQKQFQMLNNALLAEAKASADEVESAVKRMDKIARSKTRKSVDQDYLEQAQALLESVDLRRRSQIGIDRQGKWEAWAAAREAEGFDVIVPGSFEATLGQTNWTRLSVENLLALDETVKQIIHLGRLKQTLIDNQETREWDAVISEAETAGDNLGRKPPKGSFTEPGWWDSIKHKVATADAALLKMETIFDWLDNGNSNGVFNRIAFRPLAEAQAREQEMLADYYGRIRTAMETVPAASLRTWGDKITLDLIDRETGLPAVMTRQQVISMALNWGNAGNRQRLADGYGWNAAGIERVLMENLGEAEWRFVQEIWDVIDTLWPSIEKMERAINGVAPEKVEPVEIITPFGSFRGGYYPAIYDSALDYAAEEQAGRKTDLFEANYTRATTRASATKDRAAKVSRPIKLDIGVINRHLGEVIHDVTHREPVMTAHRFLTNRKVMRTVDDTLGREAREQFRPWLQHVANSWATERAGNEGIGRFMSKLRANTTMVGMGWRFTTIMTQVAGYSNSFEYVGVKAMAPAIASFWKSPIATSNFVMERSDEVRHRMENLDRDIRSALSDLAEPDLTRKAKSTLTAAREFAFHGIGYMDRMVSIPTWLGAYNKGLAAGMTEQDARYAGDKAVRLSQGAGGPKDLAAVQRGKGAWGEALKLMTMFYSYMSAFYQRQRRLGRDVGKASAKDVPGLLARAWWLLVVPPLLAELLSGRGPDDEEDEAWWVFKKMLSQSLGPIPFVRDVFEPAWDKATGAQSFGYRFTPAQGAGEALVRVAGDAGNIVEGEETKRATRNALETVGYFTGLVPGQLAASTQFLVDVGYGDADPQTFGDWFEGLTKGKITE